jgi:hypothetical protein
MDAMILLGYAQAGVLEVLESFFTGGRAIAATSAWLLENEIAAHVGAHPENQLIVDAPWLQTARVADDDIVYTDTLLRAWSSNPGRDRGEAELVALCSRHGWTGCSDDRNAHGGAALAKGQGRPFVPAMVHGVTLLAGGAAENLIATDEAWRVHQRIESRYDDPPLLSVNGEFEEAFITAVDAIRGKKSKVGSPDWPRLLTHDLDGIVKSAVRRHTPQ